MCRSYEDVEYLFLRKMRRNSQSLRVATADSFNAFAGQSRGTKCRSESPGHVRIQPAGVATSVVSARYYSNYINTGGSRNSCITTVGLCLKCQLVPIRSICYADLCPESELMRRRNMLSLRVYDARTSTG